VESAAPLISPAYDRGISEAEIVAHWTERHIASRSRT
jgi:hypothetical protein